METVYEWERQMAEVPKWMRGSVSLVIDYLQRENELYGRSVCACPPFIRIYLLKQSMIGKMTRGTQVWSCPAYCSNFQGRGSAAGYKSASIEGPPMHFPTS